MQKAKFDACLQQSRFKPRGKKPKSGGSPDKTKGQSRAEFYKSYLDYVDKNRITVEDQQRVDKIAKNELMRM